MKRSDNLSWSQLKGGIFILAALAAVAGGILMMGEKTKFFVGKGKLSVIMNDAGGLKTGAPVWLAGIDVGIVRNIRFENPQKSNRVEIAMEIDKESLKKIGKDSVVTIKTRGLLGEKYVDIVPSREIWEKPEEKVEGTTVVKLEEVMQKSSAAFDKLNTMLDKINHGEGTIGQLATNRDPYVKLVRILDRVDRTMAGIESSKGTLNRLIYDDRLYEKMVALAEKSEKAAEDVRELNRRLLSHDSSVGMLLGNREFYDKGMGMLERADRSMQALEAATIRLEKGEGTAGKLLNDKELYEKLNRAVVDVDLLVKDIKENPRRYIKFSLF